MENYLSVEMRDVFKLGFIEEIQDTEIQDIETEVSVRVFETCQEKWTN
jgi:hypothetical protein